MSCINMLRYLIGLCRENKKKVLCSPMFNYSISGIVGEDRFSLKTIFYTEGTEVHFLHYFVDSGVNKSAGE